MASAATITGRRLVDSLRRLSLFESDEFKHEKSGLNDGTIECKDDGITKRVHILKVVQQIYELFQCKDFDENMVETGIIDNIINNFKRLLNQSLVEDEQCTIDDLTFLSLKKTRHDSFCDDYSGSNNQIHNLLLKKNIINCIAKIAGNSHDIYKSRLIQSGIIELCLKTLEKQIIGVPIVNNNNNNDNNNNIIKTAITVNSDDLDMVSKILDTICVIANKSVVYRNTILKYGIIKYLNELYNNCINTLQLGPKYYNRKIIYLIGVIADTVTSLLDLDCNASQPPIEYILEAIDLISLYRQIPALNHCFTCWICSSIGKILSKNRNSDKIFEKLLQCNLIEWFVNIIKEIIKNYDTFLPVIMNAVGVIFYISENCNESQMNILKKCGLFDILKQLFSLANKNSTAINLNMMRACIVITGNICATSGIRDEVTHGSMQHFAHHILMESMKRGVISVDTSGYENQKIYVASKIALCEINSNEYDEIITPIKTVAILKTQLNPLVTRYVRTNLEGIAGMAISPWPNDIASIIIKYCDHSDVYERFAGIRYFSARAVLNAAKAGIIRKLFPKLFMVMFQLYALLIKPNIDMSKNNNLIIFCDTVSLVIETFDYIWDNGLLPQDTFLPQIWCYDRCEKMRGIVQDTSLPIEIRHKVKNFINKIDVAVTAKHV